MPQVSHIGDLSSGISITMSDGQVFVQDNTEIGGRLAGVSGNLTKKENKFNEWLQDQPPFTVSYPQDSWEPDHRIRQDPSVLHDNEYIVDGIVYIIKTYVAVHIFEASPLRFTIRLSDIPIVGDWWL